MESSPIRRIGEPAALDCGDRFHVDLRTGAVIGRVDDLAGIGERAGMIRRAYDSRAAARTASLGVGWSMAHEGLARGQGSGARPEAHLDVRLRGGAIASIEATMRRARVCVRRFEVSEGRLLRVRDEREQVIEEYEYDGPLLVAARAGGAPWRYFEYDDRGRGARCVRTWSATGARDRQITYAGDKAVVDDATGATWIVERSGPGVVVIDPEMRRVTLATERERGLDEGARSAHFDASGAIVMLDVAGAGRLSAKTDASGRITELLRDDGRRVVWRYERDSTIAQAAGPAGGSWLRASAGPSGRVLDRSVACEGGRSELAFSARYDEDGSLIAIHVGDRHATIANDLEGRPIRIVPGDGGPLTIARDRAGRAIAIEAQSGPRRLVTALAEGLEWAPDDELARRVLDSSGCEGRLGATSSERTAGHVRAVLAQAAVLGIFSSARSLELAPAARDVDPMVRTGSRSRTA